MEIWETIGLWRYPVPGFFLLAQFCLAILVAMGLLVNSSIFLYMSDKERQSMYGNCSVEVQRVQLTVWVLTFKCLAVAWSLPWKKRQKF